MLHRTSRQPKWRGSSLKNGGQWCGKQTLWTHALRRCCCRLGCTAECTDAASQPPDNDVATKRAECSGAVRHPLFARFHMARPSCTLGHDRLSSGGVFTCGGLPWNAREAEFATTSGMHLPCSLHTRKARACSDAAPLFHSPPSSRDRFIFNKTGMILICWRDGCHVAPGILHCETLCAALRMCCISMSEVDDVAPWILVLRV